MGQGGVVQLELVQAVARHDGRLEDLPLAIGCGPEAERALQGHRKLVGMVFVPLGATLASA